MAVTIPGGILRSLNAIGRSIPDVSTKWLGSIGTVLDRLAGEQHDLPEDETMAMLLLVVMVGMVKNGPEPASTEIKEVLSLDGQWEGTWTLEDGTVLPARLSDGMILAERAGAVSDALRGGGGLILLDLTTITDEGLGKFQIRWGPRTYLGIYRHEDGKLLFSFRNARQGRATSFQPGDGQHVLILRPVRSR
jgi:hypothetical protein